MGWHQDEQAMELEALEAMYTHQDEFTKLSSTKFSLCLSPFPDGEEENHVSVTVEFEYPEKYPEELPIFSLTSRCGVDSTGLEELKNKVKQELESMKGASMIFSAAQEIQEWLRNNNKPQLSMYDQMMSRASNNEDEFAKKTVEEVNSDDSDSDIDETTTYRGLDEKELCEETDRATKEKFDAWAKAFKEEMIQKGLWRGFSSEDAMTGKKLFEIDASLATRDNADEEDRGKGRDTQLWENQALFEDEDVLLSDD